MYLCECVKGLEEWVERSFCDGDHAAEFEDLHEGSSRVARPVVSHDYAQEMESMVIKAERYSIGGGCRHGTLSQLPEDR